MEIPVYDTSSGPYYYGVTNFNIANALAAIRSVKIIDRTNLFALVDVAVYDSLCLSGQLDFHMDGKVTWTMFTITVNKDSKWDSGVVDSILSDSNGNQVVLRTREL